MVDNVDVPPMYLIEEQLEKVKNIIVSKLDRGEGFVKEVGRHLLNGKGKKIRPALTLFSVWAAGGDMEEAIPLAAAVELLHTASLVHDDLVDKSHLRRNVQTINSLWGNHVAVLTGDFLFGESFFILVQQGIPEAVAVMADVVTKMCRAEINQMSNLYDLDQGRDKYIERIEGKTALFFSACCKVGALVAKGQVEVVDALTNYGLKLGMAFQIIDDLLDFEADEGVLGKPVGSDLIEGILTLPVILLFEDSSCRREFKADFDAKTLTLTDIANIRERMYQMGTFDRSFEFARAFVDSAKASLLILPDSQGKDALICIADSILERRSIF